LGTGWSGSRSRETANTLVRGATSSAKTLIVFIGGNVSRGGKPGKRCQSHQLEGKDDVHQRLRSLLGEKKPGVVKREKKPQIVFKREGSEKCFGRRIEEVAPWKKRSELARPSKA